MTWEAKRKKICNCGNPNCRIGVWTYLDRERYREKCEQNELANKKAKQEKQDS